MPRRDIKDIDLHMFITKQYLNRLKEDAKACGLCMLMNGPLPSKTTYGYRGILLMKIKRSM